MNRAASLLSFAAAALHAQAGPRPTIVVKQDAVRETYVRQVNSFGTTRVGVISGDLDAIAAPGKLSVYLPKTVGAGNLCIRVVTVDGQYEAQFAIPAADLPREAGPFAVEFKSNYAKELTSRKAAELAIEAMLATACESRNGQVLVSSWSHAVNDRDFWVLVNSGDRGGSGIVTKVVAQIDGARKEFKCEDVKADRPLSFDKRCHVELGTGAAPTRLDITRSRFDNPLPSAPVPIRWP